MVLSRKNQQILCELLLQQARVEKQIEVIRQLLCEQQSFIPFSTFQKLDRLGLNQVTAQDLRDFLGELGFPHSLSETELAILQYDQDGDLKMNYNEFLKATLTIDNSALRIKTTQRVPQDYLKGSTQIPYDVEYTLAKLFELEIRCQADLEVSKGELHQQKDFSIVDAFSCLDVKSNSTLLPIDFEKYFKANGYTVYDEEIDCLFRRLDFDNDGVISFNDFSRNIATLYYRPDTNNIQEENIKLQSSQMNRQARPQSPVKGILKSPSKRSSQQGFYQNNTVSSVQNSLQQEPPKSPVKFREDLKYELEKEKINNDMATSKIIQQEKQVQQMKQSQMLEDQIKHEQEIQKSIQMQRERLEREELELKRQKEELKLLQEREEIQRQQQFEELKRQELEREQIRIEQEKQKQRQLDLEQERMKLEQEKERIKQQEIQYRQEQQRLEEERQRIKLQEQQKQELERERQLIEQQRQIELQQQQKQELERQRIEQEILFKQEQEKIQREREEQLRAQEEREEQLRAQEERELYIRQEQQRIQEEKIEQQLRMEEEQNRLRMQEERARQEEKLQKSMILDKSINNEVQYQQNIRDELSMNKIQEQELENKRLRQYQLEKSVERMQNQIRRTGGYRTQNSPHNRMASSSFMGNSNGSMMRSRSPYRNNTHSSPYQNNKNSVVKKLQVDKGKQCILDQSYISQKQTISSKQKQTPKKYVESKKTPNKNESFNQNYPVHSATKKKFSNQKQSSLSTKQSWYRTPTKQQMDVSQSNGFQQQQQQQQFQGGVDSSSKYSDLKAQVRGKMAQLRQSVDLNNEQRAGVVNQLSKKSSISSSAQNFRPTSAQKGVKNSIKKQQQMSNSRAPSASKSQVGNFDYSGQKSGKKLTSSAYGLLPCNAYNSASKRNSKPQAQMVNNNSSIYNSGKKYSQGSLQKSQLNGSNLNSINSSKKKPSSRRQKINEDLVEMIQEVVNFEKKVERIRQDLALRPDFNIMDIFRYIDTQSRGLISSLLLEDFFKELKINFALEDIFLFMRRYDTDNDGKLRFSDFADFVTPKQLEYAQILERREATYPDFDLSLAEIISHESIKLLRQLFKCQLECEVMMEDLRKNIQRNEHFDYHEGFRFLDLNNDGFIDMQELLKFFQKNGQVITEKEIIYFMHRFDKDGDELISFGEFVEELSPRTTKVY